LARRGVAFVTKAPIQSLGVVEFAKAMSARHSELRVTVGWSEFTAMALRDHISVRVVALSRPARLLRLGNRVGIQLNRDLDRTRQTREGMHELCHYWRDDLGEGCIYSDDETLQQPREDFAETFAWYVTSPARVFVDGIKRRRLCEELQYALGSGLTTVPAIVAATSQPEERVLRWARGKSEPDAVTAQYLRRLLIGLSS
jgi:hypothetical protein